MKLNGTDGITIAYNLILFIFVSIFRVKVGGYPYHIAFNLSVILLVLLLSLQSKRSSGMRLLHLWYPVVLYALVYYQTGLVNRVIIPVFLDNFFMSLDVKLFGEFPGFLLQAVLGNGFFNEFFHFFYFNYYLIIPMTGLLLYLKDERLFESYIFQLSFLFYLCFLIFVILPVEGPLEFRDVYFREGGLFQAVVDFFYEKGETPGGAFPSSHVAATVLIAWWGSKQLPKLRFYYWSVVVFLSIATVYCMYHYAVDVFAGVLLAVGVIIAFDKLEKRQPS